MTKLDSRVVLTYVSKGIVWKIKGKNSKRSTMGYQKCKKKVVITLNLRDYQKRCLTEIKKRYERGTRSQLVVLPTGTGKTVIFVQLVLNFFWPSLILVHRDELAGQTKAKLLEAGVDPEDIGMVKGQVNEIGRKITIGSVQTLGRPDGKRLAKLMAALRPKMIVIDEAHHATAKGYRNVIDTVDPELLVGFTATPMRLDKKHLVGEVFDQIVFKRSIIEMVMAGFLVVPTRKIINTNVDLSSIAVSQGDYNRVELGRKVDNERRRNAIFQAWLKYASDRKTIVFAVDVANAIKMADTFRENGYPAHVIHGGLSSTARELILDEYKHRGFSILVNCEILTEGFDDPETDCVLMARPTLSEALYIQMIGRSLRLYSGKENALIIDVTDNSNRHSIGFQDIMPEARDVNALIREMPRAQLEFFNAMQTERGQRGETGWFNGDADMMEELGIFHDPKFRWIRYNDEGYSMTIGNGESIHIIRGALSGNMVAIAYKKDKQKEWVVEHPIAAEFVFAIAEQWASERAKQIGLKKPYGWTNPDWWNIYTTDKQRQFAERINVKPGKYIAETSYFIDEKQLRSVFYSTLTWLERNGVSNGQGNA